MRVLKFLAISMAIHTIGIIVLSHILTSGVEFPASLPTKREMTAEIFRVEPPKPTEPPKEEKPEIADESDRKSKAIESARKPAPPSPGEFALLPNFKPRIGRGTVMKTVGSWGRVTGKSFRPVETDKLGRKVVSTSILSFQSGPEMKPAPPRIEAKPTAPPDKLTDGEVSFNLKTPLPGGRIVKSMGIFGTYYAYGNESGEGQVFGGFQMLMRRLGSSISSRTSRGKLDLVFIIDTSGSMRDNIRGIRAYIVDLLNILKGEGYDLGLGLVTFADARIERIEARGITTDTEEFRNQLFEIRTEGGGDQPESTYEAIMAAVERINYRWFSKPYFVLATDAPMHDRDIDGESRYSLDYVIETLRRKKIKMDVLGIDYLPLKQLALGTGGEWFRIPGTGYAESSPRPLTDKSFAWLQGLCSIEGGKLEERIVISLPQPRPRRIEIKVKVLDPRGIRIFSDEESHGIEEGIGDQVVISPVLDIGRLARMEGIYTIIWRLRDEVGNEALLRRYVKIDGGG